MPFPQPRYDQVFVPEFGGAMENYGCVTWSDTFIYRDPPSYAEREYRALVLLHEMAHMWFGDIVTMRWWDDLWLNESFAEWACAWSAVALHRVHRHVGRDARHREAGRVRRGLRADHAPDPPGDRRRRDRRGELRRHHLPEGRGGPQAARRLRRRGRLRRGAAELLRQARLGKHHARRPDRGDRRGQRPRPVGVGRGLAGDLGHRPARRSNATTAGSPWWRRRRTAGGRCRTACGSGRTPTGSDGLTLLDMLVRRGGRRAHARRGRSRRGPAAGQRRRPDLRHRAARPGLAGADPALTRRRAPDRGGAHRRPDHGVATALRRRADRPAVRRLRGGRARRTRPPTPSSSPC